MLTLTTIELLAIIVILPLTGAIAGYRLAGNRMRRDSGGKTPAELKTEFENYRQGVTGHFEQTAELLQQMTQQYRAIYTHLARGAAELSAPHESNTHLEELQRLSLAFVDAAEHAAIEGSSDATAPAVEAAGGVCNRT